MPLCFRASLLQFCLNAANESLANGGETRRFLHLETLWRLVGKIHRKSAVLLEKYAAEFGESAPTLQHQPQQQREESQRSASLSSNPVHGAEAQFCGVLALVRVRLKRAIVRREAIGVFLPNPSFALVSDFGLQIVVDAACAVESCYTTGRLLLRDKGTSEASLTETVPSHTAESFHTKLHLLAHQRRLCLLHAQLFFNTFVRLWWATTLRFLGISWQVRRSSFPLDESAFPGEFVSSALASWVWSFAEVELRVHRRNVAGWIE